MVNSISADNDAPFRITVTALHGASNSDLFPLGGGAAICERLLKDWAEYNKVNSNKKLEITLLAPGDAAPLGVNFKKIDVLNGRLPSSLSEWDYAEYSRLFEKAITKDIIETKPDVVLTHDVAEGPTFAMMERYGIPCVPIMHVDVLDYFCRIYLKELIKPGTAEKFMLRFRQYPIPDIIRLIFDKQAEAMAFCPGIVVPSEGMRDILADTYPYISNLRDKICQISWGSPKKVFSPSEIETAKEQTKKELNIGPGDFVISQLSRISPEKDQIFLVNALKNAERKGLIDFNLTLIICGEPAYMQGQSYMAKLRKAALELKKVKVIFPGHLGGVKKAALLGLSHIFISSSSHESYGLTTMEAMAQGTPVIAMDTPGSRQTVDNTSGILIKRQGKAMDNLWKAIQYLYNNPQVRLAMCKGAKHNADLNTSEKASELLLKFLYKCAGR